MPFPETGVLLLEERHLFGAELDGPLGVLRLQRQPAVVNRVPRPFSFRIFWVVIDETRIPSSASIASSRLQPWAGCSSANALIFSTTSGGVVCGWLLWIGGRSFSPSKPCV